MTRSYNSDNFFIFNGIICLQLCYPFVNILKYCSPLRKIMDTNEHALKMENGEAGTLVSPASTIFCEKSSDERLNLSSNLPATSKAAPVCRKYSR